jgi:molecular chaperone GrpE
MNANRWLTSDMINKTQEALRTPDSEEATLRKLLLDFLEVLDSVDRIKRHSRSKRLTTAGWGRQMDALHAQVLQALEGAGVVFEDILGKSFDPTRHEAVGRVERDDIPNYTITEVVEHGCEWRGKMLRTARVIVSHRSNKDILNPEENNA